MFPMNRRALISVVALSLALGGCSTFKKLTGKKDNTVLPGQREEILSPDQYTAKSPDLEKPADGATAPAPDDTMPAPAPKSGEACDPAVDPDCAEPPPAGGNKGIFNDG